MMEITGTALAVLLIGSTHYVDVGQGKDAAIDYPTAAVAHMALPDGRRLRGSWRPTETGYLVAWEGGPQGDRRIAFEPGRLTDIKPDGEPAGTISRIVPGNPEGF